MWFSYLDYCSVFSLNLYFCNRLTFSGMKRFLDLHKSCVHSISMCGCEACWSVLSWSTQVQASACDSTPLRASDTFSTTKHVSLRNVVSLLNVRNTGFCRICAVCFPIDANPRVGKPNLRFIGDGDELVFICVAEHSAPFSYRDCLNTLARLPLAAYTV